MNSVPVLMPVTKVAAAAAGASMGPIANLVVADRIAAIAATERPVGVHINAFGDEPDRAVGEAQGATPRMVAPPGKLRTVGDYVGEIRVFVRRRGSGGTQVIRPRD